MPPRATIAIPNYNYGRFLGAAIESALAQSYGDFEILVSDNASTDDSLSVIDRYRDPRIRVLRQTENRGLYYNWNLCLQEARGEFVKILQSDDQLEPNCLERVLRMLEETDSHICFMGYCRMSEGGVELPNESIVPRADGRVSFEEVLRDVRQYTEFVPSSGNMMRTAIARGIGYGSEHNFCGDLILWAKVIEGGRICTIRSKLAKERIHGDQARRQGNALKVFNDQIYVIERLRGLTSDPKARAELEAWEADVALSAGRSFARLVAERNLARANELLGAVVRQGKTIALARAGYGAVRARVRRVTRLLGRAVERSRVPESSRE